MLQLPSYWMTRPNLSLEDETREAFEKLYAQSINGQSGPMDFTLPAPKWQFLSYLADHHDLAFHGSGDPNIETFEPRQPEDLTEFGNQKAVYASSDALWAMFFAIVDRDTYSMSLCNGCIRVANVPYYFFSITQAARVQQPWRTGTVYILPTATFTKQPPMTLADAEIHIAQLASLAPVQPLAHLQIQPADFPFLNQIRGHADERLADLAQALGTGGPLPEDKAE